MRTRVEDVSAYAAGAAAADLVSASRRQPSCLASVIALSARSWHLAGRSARSAASDSASMVGTPWMYDGAFVFCRLAFRQAPDGDGGGWHGRLPEGRPEFSRSASASSPRRRSAAIHAASQITSSSPRPIRTCSNVRS